MTTTRGAPMTSAVRVLQICEALAEHQPIGVRELARVLDAPRSTVQRALETLEAAGWAVRTDAGIWCLSSRPLLVASRAGVAGAVREIARPALERLHAATDESVRLWAREGAGVLIVLSVESAQPVRYVGPPPGTVLPLHASLTPHPVVDARELRAQLDEVLARGYAVTRHEARDDVGGVAAAVVDSTGRAVAALSVTLPMHRLTEAIVTSYGELVAAEAARLSAELAGA